MRSFAAFLLGCAMALPAMANRQFPPPSIGVTVAEAAGEAIAASGGKAFIANAAANRVAVVDDAGRATFVAVGPQPRYIVAVGFGFMTGNAGDGSVSLSRDLASSSSLPVGGSGPMVVDPAGRVYVLRPDGFVAIIDPVSFTARTFDTGLRAPVVHAVSEAALAVGDASGAVRIFNTGSGGPTPDYTMQVPGRPIAMLSFDRNALSVLAEGSTLSYTRLDFTAIPRTVQTFTLPAVGRGARMAKVVGDVLFAGFSNGLLQFDLGTRYTDFIAGDVQSIDVDPKGRAFVLGADRSLRVIEPVTLHADVLALPGTPSQVVYAPASCTIYVSGNPLSIVRAPCGDGTAPRINAQALWWVWNGSQSGWGLNVAHQGSKLFATWFTYDANGQPTWLVVSDASVTSGNQYAGDLYRTTGPAFNAPSFDPSRVTRTKVGTASFFVASGDYMIFWPKADALNAQFPLGRQLFSSPLPQCDTDVTPGALPVYQDLWWNPNESGWGLNIAHQGDILFITWFTYDTDGKATWFVGSDLERTGNATYSGTLYKTFGPPMTASPWDPSRVTRMPVGTATLTFSDQDNGTFAYTVSGISGSKSITREVFATPMTRCR